MTTCTPESAAAAGFATFNDCPHVCIDVPDANLTVTCRTSGGQLITFSFAVYDDNNPPQCVDVRHHTPRNLHTDQQRSPIQRVIVFRDGGGAIRTELDDANPALLTTFLLHD